MVLLPSSKSSIVSHMTVEHLEPYTENFEL